MKEKKDIKPGQIIHSEKPFVYALRSKVHTDYCDFCFKKGKLLKCSGCHYVYYCGRICQKEGWSVHKAECSSLQRVAPRIIPDAARLMARLIRKLKKGGDRVRSYYTELNFRMYRDLMSHYPDLKEDSKRMEHFSSICGVLFEFLGNDEVLPNSADLMGMYGRMCVNSFNICDNELKTLGTGIYLGASVVDHSCEPNATPVFNGTTLNIRSLKAMPFLDWSKIFISYIDILNTTKERQEELARNYYFKCSCIKCLKPEPLDEMIGASCPEGCEVPLNLENSIACPKCKLKISDEFMINFKEVTELTTQHLNKMTEVAYFDVCKVSLSKQEGVLHPFNIKHVKTLDLAFESSIDLQKFDDALIYGKKLTEPFLKYYGKLHPITGLLYLKLAKILLYKNDTSESLKHLKEAYDILKITHGSESKIFKEELMPLLQQANYERLKEVG